MSTLWYTTAGLVQEKDSADGEEQERLAKTGAEGPEASVRAERGGEDGEPSCFQVKDLTQNLYLV